MKAASIRDYRLMAKKRVPHFLFEYLDGGSYSETTMNKNKTDLEATALRQRILRDVSDIDTSTTLFGSNYEMPVGLAPVGLAGMYAKRGETQAVRAAEAAGVPFSLSTVGVCPIAEVAKAASKPFWFQLYSVRDRGFMKDILTLARDAKCSALIFTVDMPLPGARYRDYHSGLAGDSFLVANYKRVTQAMIRPKWSWDVGLWGKPHQLGNVAPVLGDKSGLEDFMSWMKNNFDPSVSWDDLQFIRDNWDGPIIIKGILDSQDALKAEATEVDGIVVSNHGGRQLDGVSSTAKALPKIADAVSDKLTILADGGISSGLDVIRMLALGADSVLIGRSWVYGLAARGQQGVEHVLEIIKNEMQVAMALTGCRNLDQIDRHILDKEIVNVFNNEINDKC